MEAELTLYEGSQALAVAKRGNYEITSPLTGNTITLKRGVDFGMLPKLKRPTLFKSGSEKICAVYGLLQHYSIESKVEEFGNNPFFYYAVKCELVKIASDGKEYVFSTGYGSANTAEKSNGFNGAYDAANSALKKAVKRSLVAASLAIANLSDMFYQDIESEDVATGYEEIQKTQDPNAKITSAQVKRLFAIANDAGYNAAEAKNKLAKAGYTKATEVTQDKYEEVCNLFA